MEIIILFLNVLVRDGDYVCKVSGERIVIWDSYFCLRFASRVSGMCSDERRDLTSTIAVSFSLN